VNHQELVKVMKQELYSDDTVLSLVLFGSVSRCEENPNSDIDLLVITNKNFFQQRHKDIRLGEIYKILFILNYLEKRKKL
jgi:predicted nucleotidyltransferase